MSRFLDKKEILERIKAFYKLKSDAKLASFLGIPPTTLASWYSRNTFNLDLIYEKCVDIDLKWLLTGEEVILKNESSLNTQASAPQQENMIPYYMYKDLQEENRKLEREIGRLEEQLKHLKDLIKKEENKSLTTNSDSHAKTVQKKRSSSRISGSSVQPDVPTIK